LKILQAFPLQPTTLVRTGNGLHAHWDLQQPVTLANELERNDAKALWRDFQRALQRHFTGHGFAIDSVGDLSRLYRIPGTFNHKSSPFKPVEIIERGEKVTLEAVRKLVAETAHKEAPKRDKKKKAKKQSLADHEKIMEGCHWFREKVVEGAATCPYPDWFAGVSITARCENGEEIFHEYSAKHPEYKRDEAAKLLQQVSGEDSGPRTCASIREQLGHEEHCAACLHWGKITSPIQLGRSASRPYDPGEIGPIPLGYAGSNFLFRNQQTNQVVKKSANQLMNREPGPAVVPVRPARAAARAPAPPAP
jgi:hypothetical protein